MSETLPVLGAALSAEVLERLHNWVFERQRDIEIQDFCELGIIDRDWRPLAEKYRRLLAGHTGRVGIHGPFYGLQIDTQDSEVAAVVARRLHQGLDICAGVGADQMVIHSPFTTWDAFNLDSDPANRAALIERTHRNIGAVVKRAENDGVVLVIENIEDRDPGDRLALAHSFNSPAVRLSIDTGHAHYAHGSTGAPPVDYFVNVAGDMLHHIHLQDADGHADRHWPIGHGSIHWRSVFAALGRLSSNPRLILELRNHVGLVESADWLAAQGLAE